MLTYRPDIDGLRALAVLPVVFYHAGFTAFGGGYVGVDIFFVISGYLITSLIFDEIGKGEFRFRNFYVRRIRRLFPALFTVVLATCIPAYWLLLPGELEDFGQSVASLAVFASNILFWSEAGYFASAAEMKPLLHTWSLAIEEQYYLLFPALLLLIRRVRAAPYLMVVTTLFGISLVISATTVYSAPEAAFYLLPSRTWELLLGSIIAMTGVSVTSQWLREGLAVAGLVLIAVAVLAFEPDMPFPGLAALIPCLGTAFLIVTGRHETTVVANILSDARLVFFGLISYSLYLWHWPILVFAKHYFVTPLDLTVTWTLLAAAVLMAYLSWRFIERPFRGAGGLLTNPRLFQVTGATVALLVGIGVVFDIGNGLPARLNPQVATILAVADDKPKRRKQCEGVAPQEMKLDRLCRVIETDTLPTFLVWGDSHANMLIPGIAAEARAQNLNGRFAVANGCVPLLDVERVVRTTDLNCTAFNRAVLQLIEQHPELSTIILAARWGLHADGVPYGEQRGRTYFLRDDQATAASVAANRAIFTRAMAATVAELARLHRQVVVLGPIPEVTADVPLALAKARWRNRQIPLDIPTAHFLERQTAFFNAAQAAAGAGLIRLQPLHPALCDAGTCRVTAGAQPLYFDDNHLASTGISAIAPALQGLFAAQAPGP